MSSELCSLSASQISHLVGTGQASAAEVVEAHLDALEHEDLHAVITVCRERALQHAARVRGGRLAGVPLVVKDLIDVAGTRTTYGSRIYAEHVSKTTAPVVQKLEDEGAIVVAKANLQEFAWGLTSQNPHWGDVHNPVHPGRTPGGSSGGSAAAVAAGLAPLALGTDTGGSIRVPAACCEVVGFKPSHGALPMDGIFPVAPTLDTVGPMARTVRDCALAWSVLSGQPEPSPRIPRLRIGVTEAFAEDARLQQLGDLVVATLPERPGDLSPVFLGEVSQVHAPTYPSRQAEYSEGLQRKLDRAGAVPEAAYRQAHRAMMGWRAEEHDGLSVDLYALPVLGCELPAEDVDEAAIRDQFGSLARPVNELGWAGLAIGNLQFVGPDDRTVLAAGLAYSDAQ